jgi:tetratricopeptide (TPR) repeat protein
MLFGKTYNNRHEEALHSYERALQIAANYGKAHAYIGLAYYHLGRNREALESLNRTIRMKPRLKDDPYWLHMLGLMHGKAELWEQSFEAFTKLTESNGRNGSA